MAEIKLKKEGLGFTLLFIASPLGLLVIWELCTIYGFADERFFPRPTVIAIEMVRLLKEGPLLLDILASLTRIVLGLLFGFIPGVLIGMAMGLWKWPRAFFAPLVGIFFPIPKIAILPLLLIVFGINWKANVMVVVIGVFFIALINTYTGVRQVEKIHFDVARVYGIRRRSVLTRIVLMSSLPYIFAGLKLSAGKALIIIVAAEMVAADRGLGYRIWMSWEAYFIKELYVCLAIIAFIGISLAVALEKLESRLIHWKRV